MWISIANLFIVNIHQHVNGKTKMWYAYIMEHYSSIKKRKLRTAPTKWVLPQDHYATWKKLVIRVYTEWFGEGNGTPLQYSCLENPMDGGAWWAAVHGVAKSQIRLSDLTFTFHFHALEKEMAAHSSALAWRIPGTAEPGGLPSMGRTESDTTEVT